MLLMNILASNRVNEIPLRYIHFMYAYKYTHAHIHTGLHTNSITSVSP